MRRVGRLASWLAAAVLVLATLPVLAASPTRRPSPRPPATARIAVAANFAELARTLAADYGRQSGHSITISSASTGKLYAQIHNGAPFDVLLAADASTPRLLVNEGYADGRTLQNYAIGRLVLWSRDPQRVVNGEALLRRGEIPKLAIANPELAPYGAAARETLEYVRRWSELRPRLVIGENVGQAAQFVASGAAPLGLLPASFVGQAGARQGGSYWEVPARWHKPIVQSAVLLRHGRNNPAATGFLRYLQTPAVRAKIRAHGYD